MSKKSGGLYGKLVKLFFRDRARGVLMVVLLATAAVLAAVGPQLLGNVTDVVAAGLTRKVMDWAAFWQAAGLLSAVYAGQFFAKWQSGRLSAHMASQVAYHLRQGVERKLWRLPLRYFDTVRRGQIMSVVTNDVDNVVATLNQTGGDLLYYALMLIGMIVMMLRSSWPLALVTIAIVPLSAFLVRVITKRSHKQYKTQWTYMADLNSKVEESFNGHAVIKAFGQEPEFNEAFRQKNAKLFESSYKAQTLSGLIQPISRAFTNVGYVIVALAGALNIVRGTMTMGDVMAFIQYSRQFQQPFTQLASMFSTMQSGMASLERVYAFLDEDEEPQDAPGQKNEYEFRGAIDFRDVSFSYVPEKKLIEHMNLRVRPGQMVAIVGGTGAGKTTLVNLIERFYDPNAGEIILDGDTPVSSLTRDAWRENIGMVLQDTWLYEGTIRDNLCYSLPEGRAPSDEEFEEACKATFVDDFVKTLPEGYDTVVNNELTSISAGEKQLLTIARAFLRRPNLLILDEATSSVDTRTEALIQKALDRLREGRTSFVIAHRLSTIRNADIILVMDSGRIVEQGDHQELMRKNGAYAKLYRSQFET